MEIEVVEFYPISKTKNTIRGTLHVYLIDYQYDIRGIHVFVKQLTNGRKYIYIDMPFSWGIDQETKLKVRYPILGFTDKAKQKEFMKALISKGNEYVKKVTDFEIPEAFKAPHEPKKPYARLKPLKTKPQIKHE
jgi:hypothetical protein